MKTASPFKTLLAAAVSVLALGVAHVSAAEAESCGKVRFSDVGWTDVTSTTATASVDPTVQRIVSVEPSA